MDVGALPYTKIRDSRGSRMTRVTQSFVFELRVLFHADLRAMR